MIGLLPMVNFTGCVLGDSVKRVAVVFSLLMLTHHSFAQLATVSKAVCILYLAVVAYSSEHQRTRSLCRVLIVHHLVALELGHSCKV